MRVEARRDGAVVDGVEAWWDNVEIAAHRSPDRYPLVTTISPYGDVIVPANQLDELARECEELAREAESGTIGFLVKIADLARRTAVGEFADLRFNGD
jgi:hypothetical protein